MIIANPIYDVVFKFLMEDERIAKFFIGTLLEETIEEIAKRPPESTFRIPGNAGEGLTVLKLDFVATVRTANGELKKVIVEIQKARNDVDLMRFRNYLGEQYKRQDEIHGKLMTLPTTTIYLLGFKLPDIDASVVRVNREYTDLLSHQVITHKSEFIEQLSHDCYVVQLKRITGKVQTKLERLLSVFEQAYFIDEHGILKDYPLQTDDEDLKRMLVKLLDAASDPAKRKKIADEHEAHRVINAYLEERIERVIAENHKLQIKKKQMIEEQRAVLEAQAKLIEELQTKLEGK